MKLLKPREVCDLLGISSKNLLDLVEKNKIPFVDIPSSRRIKGHEPQRRTLAPIRFKQKDVEKFIEECTCEVN